MEVAASVVGLLTAVAKVSLSLEKTIESTINAPALMQDMHDEIQDIIFVLTKLQSLVPSHSNPNASMPLADHRRLLNVMLRSMATTQELENLVPQLAVGGKMNMWDRLQWLWVEPTLTPLHQRLQSHRESLNIILTTLI